MLLELTGRNQKQQFQFHRFVIEGGEWNPLLGTTNNLHDIRNQIRASVPYPDTETDAGAHGPFTLRYCGENRRLVIRFNLIGHDRMPLQIVNSFLTVLSPKVD